MAKIEGSVVEPGDFVRGQRVVSIRDDRVILDDGNKEYEVLMREQWFKFSFLLAFLKSALHYRQKKV